MNGAFEITRKDLSLLIRDRRALFLLLLLPFFFIMIVGMSTGQFLTGNDKPQQYRLAFVDHDQSETAKHVVQTFEKHQEIEVRRFPNDDVAAEAARKGEVMGVVTLGPKFEADIDELDIRDLLRNDGVLLTDMADVRIEVPSTVAEGELMRYFLHSELYRAVFPQVARKNRIIRPFMPKEDGEAAQDLPVDDVQAANVPASKSVSAIRGQGEVKPKKANVYQFLVPGFTVMFVFFLINIMARSFIVERDLGTLRRLRLAPIPPVSILIGKTLPFYVCSVLQTSLLFLSGRLLFNMPWGPEPIYLVPVILCTSAAATALGLLLATWVHTDQQVSAYGTSLVLILGGISGCFIPRPWLPELMKTLSLATPHAWALKAFDAVLTPQVVDSIVVLDYCAVLLAFAAFFFAAGWRRFHVAA